MKRETTVPLMLVIRACLCCGAVWDNGEIVSSSILRVGKKDWVKWSVFYLKVEPTLRKDFVLSCLTWLNYKTW